MNVINKCRETLKLEIMFKTILFRIKIGARNKVNDRFIKPVTNQIFVYSYFYKIILLITVVLKCVSYMGQFPLLTFLN